LANAAIHFIDMNGKNMEVQMNRNINKNRLELDLASVEAGMYMLKFDYFDKTRILKVIKQ